MDPITLLLSVTVSLGLLALSLAGAFFLVQRMLFPEPTAIQIRMRRFANMGEQERLSRGRGSLSALIEEKLYGNDQLGLMLSKYEGVEKLRKLMQQAGVTMPVDQFILKFMILPPIAGLLIGALIKIPLCFLAGFIVAVGSVFFLKFKKNAITGKLLSQLPDTLQILTSSLRAGHSFQAAMNVVASEMPAPISTEFAKIVNDISLGVPIRDAMLRLSETYKDLIDLQMMTTAILIQRETGGNLAEVLDTLGRTIRERFKLQRQLKALTGQAQATGYLLGFAPLAMFIVLSLFFPAYIAPLYEHFLGNVLIGVCIFLQVIGFFIIRRILDIQM
jgi:tight adherence protein B